MKRGRVKYTYLFDRAPTSSPSEGVAKRQNDTQESIQESVYDRAARVIQRTWSRHVDIAVFKYFKNLVHFRNQGDPRLLLKHVIPREADMLDAASGVYIRFRLGGTTFPPNIYYKIFTHHPIVDLCASSPRDYTHAGQKRPVPIQIHNGQSVVRDDCAGWYRRVENNTWRLLSGKICPFADPIAQNNNNKGTEFHHNRIHRQQDADRRKKIRKIEWMKKMYDEGALHARTELRKTAQLLENSTQGMVRLLQSGAENIPEWEIDELIEWTNALNFDEYFNNWKDLGTSHSSALRKDNQQVVSQHNAFEFSQFTQDSSNVVTQSTVLPGQVSIRENSSDCII